MVPKKNKSASGFTILELLVALSIAVIIVCAAGSAYIVQQRHYGNQRLRHAAWQNLWGGLLVLEQEIRMIGYDPEDCRDFGIVDVRRYDIVNATGLDKNGQPVLFYTCDMDENGGLDLRNKERNREHPKFRISDVHNSGRVCLTWDNGSGRRPLADHIHAMGIAYALDRDEDGRLDAAGDANQVIWAVDSDNDNLLDTNIDTNNDGIVDEADDQNGDGAIDWGDGGKLDGQVSLVHIRAVRVWLMALTERPLQGHSGQGRLVVGDRIYPPPGNGHGCYIVSSTIVCRNL